MMLKPLNIILFPEAKRNRQNFVIHHPPAQSTACSHPPLALPFPSSHAADKLYHRVQAVAADNTKTQTFTPQLPEQLK